MRREILADLLRELGPASPTLCTGWTAHDLAAHLVTRERVLWAGPGLVVGALHGITERAERATMRAHTYPELVEMFRTGPPRWHPTRFAAVDDAANLIEFYVHTEDLRRAAPGYDVAGPSGADDPSVAGREFGSGGPLTSGGPGEGASRAAQAVGVGSGGGSGSGGLAGGGARTGWNAAESDAAPDRNAMWASLRLIGLAGFRQSAIGVVAERTDAPGRLTLRRREPAVEIVGPPEELLLYAFGRRAAARVELRGDPEAVGTLVGAPHGV
ncbi:maleylpyruvate isomerase family mycothiol-dependent enzyme [Frankia sp. Cpl3]|uniref:maleylpyruvate isomerase family mycothiol-dependent enzyme n=1 Tax=Parafrankia colletiae TaxID=573497 RepID=UPI001F524F08|nr:maleylpyruvate isomerase family mycothiol-dependent enzyme [Parafrankia colletiae]MCK9899256.1 maleylpyruvate isomerase family mycothiol-dependent enzyme [Frankia sp. Cpl3]